MPTIGLVDLLLVEGNSPDRIPDEFHVFSVALQKLPDLVCLKTEIQSRFAVSTQLEAARAMDELLEIPAHT